MKLPALLVSGGVALLAAEARAAECSTVGSNVVYATGSSAAKGLLSQVGKVLATHSPPVTLVYVSSGSCTGVNAVLNTQTPIMALATSANPPTFWDSGGNANTCDISTPVQADVGISDVFAQTCVDLPNGLGNVVDNLGPVQAMTFVVPNSSTQKSISAEAAYMIFGFGNQSGVKPWIDETSMFVRGATSGTQQMLGVAIGVLAPQWHGAVQANSNAVVSAINTANGMGGMAAEKAIGIVATDVADANRLTMHELAYQHYFQNCGYLPDSAPAKFDKANVRDGHYAVWGPIHLLRRTDIDMANQQYIKLAVDYVTGAQDPPGVDLIQFEATNHVVPQCAMRVKRDQEMGPLSNFTPQSPCGCYYELQANTTTTCTACTKNSDCSPGWTCPIHSGTGYCEPP